jgi:hypothetical protein
MARSSVKLSDMIEQLKSELQIAKEKGLGNEMLTLTEVTITTKFVVRTTGKGGAKFDFYVLTGDVGATVEGQHSHELTIKLLPIDKVDMGE